MPQFIYVSSPVKLPQGDFGSNPISSEKPNVFNTELDIINLYFKDNYNSELKKNLSFSYNLTYEFQVVSFVNKIPLKGKETGSAFEKKCLDILYKYIEKALLKSGNIEMFTCWNGEENVEFSNRRKVQWKNIKSPYDLVLNDLEIVKITL